LEQRHFGQNFKRNGVSPESFFGTKAYILDTAPPRRCIYPKQACLVFSRCFLLHHQFVCTCTEERHLQQPFGLQVSTATGDDPPSSTMKAEDLPPPWDVWDELAPPPMKRLRRKTSQTNSALAAGSAVFTYSPNALFVWVDTPCHPWRRTFVQLPQRRDGVTAVDPPAPPAAL